MVRESADPTAVGTVVVAAEDLVAALAANRRDDRRAVLRLTPPFSGRMRARLHAGGDDYATDPAPVHVPPESLVSADAPPYPTPAATEDRLRADPDEAYSVEAHRRRHADAVAAWREAVPEHVVGSVALDVPGGTHRVSVSLLGSPRQP